MDKIQKITQCFIGKQIKVIESTNKHLVGIEGRIVDETKNTFEIQTSNQKIKLDKNQIKIIIDNNIIDGKKIMKQPELRLKMRTKNE